MEFHVLQFVPVAFSPVTTENSPSPLDTPIRYLQTLIASPLSLLFSCLHRISERCCCSVITSLRPFTQLTIVKSMPVLCQGTWYWHSTVKSVWHCQKSQWSRGQRSWKTRLLTCSLSPIHSSVSLHHPEGSATRQSFHCQNLLGSTLKSCSHAEGEWVSP